MDGHLAAEKLSQPQILPCADIGTSPPQIDQAYWVNENGRESEKSIKSDVAVVRLSFGDETKDDESLPPDAAVE